MLTTRGGITLTLCWSGLLLVNGCGPGRQAAEATKIAGRPAAVGSPSVAPSDEMQEHSECTTATGSPVELGNAAIEAKNRGQYDAAIELLDCAIELHPRVVRLHNIRGNAFAAKGQYQRAIQDFDSAIRIDPQYAEARFNRGNCYLELNEVDEALSSFSATIQIDPSWASPYVNRANVYRMKGLPSVAAHDYIRATEIGTPREAAYAYQNLYMVYKELGKENLAQRAWANFEKAWANRDSGGSKAWDPWGFEDQKKRERKHGAAATGVSVK